MVGEYGVASVACVNLMVESPDWDYGVGFVVGGGRGGNGREREREKATSVFFYFMSMVFYQIGEREREFFSSGIEHVVEKVVLNKKK